MPTNADLARWYKDDNLHRPHDFVRRNANAEIPNGGGGALELEHIDSLYSVDGGFELVYSEGTLMLPLEGTEDIIVDVDETNKKVNIHLDATVRSRLARMLLTPVSNPAEQMMVTILPSGSQQLVPLSKDVDLNATSTIVNGVTVPNMTVSEANAILLAFTEGGKSSIKWSDGSTIYYFAIISTSSSSTSNSISIMMNQYFIKYTWSDTTVSISVNEVMFE